MNYRSTENSIAWFRQHFDDGSLVIQPAFQRRPVWTEIQKSNLIESVLLSLPIPEIYMTSNVEPDGATTHLVVDGQQRITSILEFVGAGDLRAFELKGLRTGSRWEGFTFELLSDTEKSQFYGYALAVRLLPEVSFEDIQDLFIRFNKYLTPLNPQELRHATYTGPFAHLAEELANDPYWAENQVVDTKSIRRMKDIEFTSDLLIGVLDGPQSGNVKTLDDYYMRYELDESSDLLHIRRVFLRTLDTMQAMFPDIKYTRWRNRSDFYSLFVALAGRLEFSKIGIPVSRMRDTLDVFASEIKSAQASEKPGRPLKGPEHVVDYIGAVRRGSSDRARRVARHRALEKVLDQALEGAA